MKNTIIFFILFVSFIDALGSFFPNNIISNNNEITNIQFSKTTQHYTNSSYIPKIPLYKTDSDFYANEINENRYDILSFSLTNNSDEEIINIRNRYYTCFEVTLYEVLANNQCIKIGNTQGNAHRITDNNHIDFIFKTKLPLGATKKFIIATRGKFPLIQYILTAGKQIDIIEHSQKKEIITFIYFGICIVMLFYNVFLCFSTKERTYVLYVLFLAFNCITQLDIKGFTYKYIWDGNEFWGINNFMFFLPLTMITGTMFIREFTHSKTHTPTLDYIYKIIPIFTIISALGVMFLQRNYFYFGITITSALWGWLSFFIAVMSYVKGNKSSFYVIIAQSAYQINITFFVLAINGDIPNNMFTFYSLEIGSVIDLVFLSLSLADRINTLKSEKEQSQLSALKSEKKYRIELVNRKVILEQQVEEQTQELRAANFELKRQALSAQINPHFIFNVLNSIQCFILDKKLDNAEKYIAKFSKLMRFYLDSSVKPTISINSEIDALERYLQLEQLRFDNSFDYKVNFDGKTSQIKTNIGSMLILPFVENAVWHGMRGIGYRGEITIDITVINDQLLEVIIDDNGCGIEKAKSYKREGHESNGVRITKERIHLLHSGIGVETPEIIITDGLSGKGTQVKFTIPYTIIEL